jgi:beta-1,4-N-acetylglucosaminyltransferase
MDMNPKICIVSSCGGHLTEALALSETYDAFEHFFVVNDKIALPRQMEGKTYFIAHSERDLRFVVNLFEAFRILWTERPSLILSTGAGPAVPFALFAKLFRVPVIYVEISAQVTAPSLTGRIMYYLADHFFFQWKALQRFFPKGTYGGSLL